MLANEKVLVLNKSWTPIKVITLEKALTKVTKTNPDGTPKARIIDPIHDFQSLTWEDWTQLRPAEDEQGMQSVNAVFRIPRVIQYTQYDKIPTHKVNYNRRTIYRRDKNMCQYCYKKKPTSELSIDHVIPKCQGGKSVWTNVVVACTGCNAKKAGRTPKEAGMKLLREPKKPKFSFEVGDIKIESWQAFLGEAYWLAELEHDEE